MQESLASAVPIRLCPVDSHCVFLRDHDQEPTQKDGGQARNLPEPFATENGVSTWGETLHTLWKDAGNGRPVSMASAKRAIRVRNP